MPSISRRNTARPYRTPAELVRSARWRALAYLTATNKSQQCIASVIPFSVDPPVGNSMLEDMRSILGTLRSSARGRLNRELVRLTDRNQVTDLGSCPSPLFIY